ncbi:glycosyltransferase [Kitasatospora sp. NPDC048365]|uniref:glycosyltransferase n=1 Tax=Kitasatospora sp. NPDC048365 TaxID=3364050 RepID=UPI0037139673
MRFLFTAPAAAGHLFPMVPTAHALLAAGHEVLFAGSAPLDFLRNTGIPVVDVGDGGTLGDHFARMREEGVEFVSNGRSDEETFRLAAIGFALHARVTVPALLRVAEAWQPDVLVHAPFQAAAPLVAAKLGIPTVVHNFGAMPTAAMVGMLAEQFADEYREHGVSGPVVGRVLDVLPASLGGDGTGWRSRYVPYNGGGVVPVEQLGGAGGRPKVVVTLGTVLTEWDGVRAITGLVRQAAAVDADFLLAVGEADLAMLGELPANVRPLPWVPLSVLVGGVDAIVHHGGDGSTWTSAAAGLPQLVLPQGANQFINAGVVADQGIGLRSSSEEVDSALLERLLTDEGLRKAAAGVRAEIAALPSPAELVPELVAYGKR